jgi:hypothetical protein
MHVLKWAWEDLLVLIQGLNCRLGFLRSAERDESESAAPAGVAVLHDYLLDVSIRLSVGRVS